jgi:hypothetical protein
MYFNSFEDQILLNKKGKMLDESYEKIYQSVMGEVIFNSIPEQQKEQLSDIPARDVKYHIGEVVEEILPFEEFDERVKQTNEFNTIYIRGIIEGLTDHYSKLIGEANDEEETKEAPKEVEDVLGEMENADIEEEISQTIKKEMKEDAEKVKKDKEEAEELEEELDVDDEEDMDFEDEVDESETIGESTFDAIQSLDPFNNKVTPDKDYISIIKERVIDTYSNVNAGEDVIMQSAKLDTIVYVAIAVAFDRLRVMKKKEFLERMDDMEDTPPEELEDSFNELYGDDEEGEEPAAEDYEAEMDEEMIKESFDLLGDETAKRFKAHEVLIAESNIINDLRTTIIKQNNMSRLLRMIKAKEARNGFAIGKNTGKRYKLKDADLMNGKVTEPLIVILDKKDFAIIKPIIQEIVGVALKNGYDPVQSISVALSGFARTISKELPKGQKFILKTNMQPKAVLDMCVQDPALKQELKKAM